MAKAFTPKIISANHLFTGETIYLTTDGWSPLLSQASIAANTEEENRYLERAKDQPDVAVGPYAVDVTVKGGKPAPLKYREKFRVTGPTVGALNQGAVVAAGQAI